MTLDVGVSVPHGSLPLGVLAVSTSWPAWLRQMKNLSPPECEPLVPQPAKKKTTANNKIGFALE